MSEKSVFLLGPGYIGGQILEFLLERNYHVTTLTRRESTAAEFHAQGIKTVIGSLDDRSVIQKQVSVSDIVFHTATADHLPSAEAVLDGLEERAKNNLQTIYINTSGTSILSDNSAGAFKSDMVFEDDKPEGIDALPDSAPHRTIDLPIVRRREILGEHAKIAIMMPPLIYGVGPAGRSSIQLPTLVRYSLKHRYAGQIGEGRSVWSQIHVKDLARGYLTLLDWLERTPAEEVLPNPYWFCENGNELSWNDCTAEIGRVLYEAGKIESSTPRTIPVSNYGDLFGKWSEPVVGSNSRSRANRLRKLGWEPKEKKTLASLAEDEIPLIMQETGPFEGYGKVVAS
ncbi:NAD dependent epimerase/dehydratase [Schizosaccharomyces cryophilus OY26]|uniref:NAD dependent epimerase/dehydratase n=1 Tax=Schizosaccharomyces cryophilus (strain OY26 / ATCC MYA-4695 / CBS 11777 / NBRC 106824 / NRRL Y48691) TaxID=653667 RepID=S9VZG9_SCHCR|nr:NAD dependent epimerase/dehydratase [Schizosaccharomyces cryophilus OY26]EPY53033.1 NAD dependent epimerase/dehydratase [Schizosaccharomyces cryophilus OY26]